MEEKVRRDDALRMKRLRALREENDRPEKIVADLSLDRGMDFVRDRLATGSKPCILAIVDLFSRFSHSSTRS